MIPDYISISECCITQDAVPQDVGDKLLKWHIHPMNYIRHLMGVPIWASRKSGWRTVAHELIKKRNGKSQHCFLPGSLGAVDWTTKPGHLDRLLMFIFLYTDYTRVCLYKNFIHCDYKEPFSSGRRLYFEAGDDSVWKLIEDARVLWPYRVR